MSDGLIALARVETSDRARDRSERRDRRGRLRLRHGVVLVGGDPSGRRSPPVSPEGVESAIGRVASLEGVPQPALDRLVLDAAGRSRSTVAAWIGDRADPVAWRLAREGIVESLRRPGHRFRSCPRY